MRARDDSKKAGAKHPGLLLSRPSILVLVTFGFWLIVTELQFLYDFYRIHRPESAALWFDGMSRDERFNH